MMRTAALGALMLTLVSMLAACASSPAPAAQARFLENLSGLCGQAYEGRVVTTDPADAAFASERLVMHVRGCHADELRIPFHVGENRSRTWVITRNEDGLRLKHDHRHEDGSEDPVTQYGGDTVETGRAAWATRTSSRA